MFPPPQDDAEFAQRAKQTRSRWALAKAYSPSKSSSKSEAMRALKKHARIALGDEAVWPAAAVIKVGAASVVPTICIMSASLVMFSLCAPGAQPLGLARGRLCTWQVGRQAGGAASRFGSDAALKLIGRQLRLIKASFSAPVGGRQGGC